MARNGKLTFPNGTVFSGIFKDDKPISGHLKTEDWEGTVDFFFEESNTEEATVNEGTEITNRRYYKLVLVLENGDKLSGCILNDGVLLRPNQ